MSERGLKPAESSHLYIGRFPGKYGGKTFSNGTKLIVISAFTFDHSKRVNNTEILPLSRTSVSSVVYDVHMSFA